VRSITRAVAALALLLAAPLGAQALPPLAPGTSVRLWSPTHALESFEATVVTAAPETLVVRSTHRDVEHGRLTRVDTLPVSELTRLERRRGRNWGKVALYTLGGAAIGGGLGATLGHVGHASLASEEKSNRLIRRSATQVGLAVGAVVGAALGTRASARWVEVPLRGRVGVAAEPDRVGIRLAF
jgi:hypothetical protein